MPAASRRGMTTASTPAASAVRRQAPRLCGSWTPSSTTRSSGRPAVSRCSTSVRSPASSRAEAPRSSATTPWWRVPAARSSSRLRAARCTVTPAADAVSSNAPMRSLSMRRSISSRFTRDGSSSSSRATAWMPALQRALVTSVASQTEVDAAGIQVHLVHGDRQFVAEGVFLPPPAADQALAAGIVFVVIVAQGGDVHEPVDLVLGNLHEQTEVGDAGHNALVIIADLVFHELALQPGLH